MGTARYIGTKWLLVKRLRDGATRPIRAVVADITPFYEDMITQEWYRADEITTLNNYDYVEDD